MTHHATGRPVSGKLMTPGRGIDPRGLVLPDVVDAEFETVPAVRGETRGVEDASLSYRPGLELLGGGGGVATPEARRPSGGRLFWTVGAGLVFGAFWVAGGHSAILGTTEDRQAGPVAALTLSDISSRVDRSGGRPVILVDGNAGNDGSEPADLHGLEIRVADLEGRVIRYKLGTSSRSLAPGERFAFSSRLDVPKSGVKTVSVTFAQ